MTILNFETIRRYLNLLSVITGEWQSFVQRIDDLVDYGIVNESDANFFLSKINELRRTSGTGK